MSRSAAVFLILSLLPTAACRRADTPSADATSPPALPKLNVQSYREPLRTSAATAYLQAQTNPSDPESVGRLGMLLHAFGQTESAEICYRRALALAPRRFAWAYYLALAQSLDNKNESAAATLRQAIELDPGYVPARLKLAEILLGLNHPDEARAAAQAILQDNPNVAPAHYLLGRAASATGHTPDAAQSYGKACELWPTYGTAHYALALLLQSQGRSADAQTHMAVYQKYKADGDPQPEDPQLDAVRALDNSALAHLMKGVDLENSGRLPEAIAEHEEAVRQDPKLAQAFANLISLYARSGQPAKADQAYLSAVALNPNLPQCHYDYGVFLAGLGRYREAEAAFRKALASSPHYAEAHSNLGAMLERAGRLDEAAAEYRAAVENKPNFRQAHYQLGHLLLMRKKPADAIAELTQTLTPEDSDTPRFTFALGVAYAENRNFPEAERYLDQAGARAASLGQEQLAIQIQAVLASVRKAAN